MSTRRFFTMLLAFVAFSGAAPKVAVPVDSQIVLQRYELEMTDLSTPKAMIFSYSVSQAGPTAIEQRHRVYRQGLEVRDETIAVNGQQLSRKVVRIGHRPDRYTLARLAPRTAAYAFVFVRTAKLGNHLQYVYDATPLETSASGFVVKRLIIDGERFLPSTIAFSTAGAVAHGSGQIDFAGAGKYWVPLSVNVDGEIAGKPARERITWSDYSFPSNLPASTFQGAKPLPHATLPPI